MSNLKENELIQSYIASNHFGKLLEMDFDINSPGKVMYSMTVQSKHLATKTVIHGGAITTLLDATVGVGALSLVCQANKVVSTIEMKVTFFGPAILGDVLTGESFLMKQGKTLIFMEGTIVNQDNVLIAKASAILNCYPKEKAGY